MDSSVYEGRGGRSERYVPFTIVGFEERFTIMQKLSWSRNGVAHEKDWKQEQKRSRDPPF
jgi:hypothetical protein